MTIDRDSLHIWLFEHNLSEEQLEEIADRARRTYVATRRAFYPDYNPKRFNMEDWLIVAQRVVEAKASPEEYVRLQFAGDVKSVWVSTLKSPKGIATYAANKEDTLARVKERLALQAAKLKHLLDEGIGLEEALEDRRNTFDHMFIYSVACEAKLCDVADRHVLRAGVHLIDGPFRTVYGEAFPQAMSLLEQQHG